MKKTILLALGFFAITTLGFVAYEYFSFYKEAVNTSHSSSSVSMPASKTSDPLFWVSFQPDTPYKRRRTFDLLGYRVAQFSHTAYPQEFLVMSGVDSKRFDSLFSENLDPSLIESIANPILMLKNPKNPDRIYFDDFKQLKTGQIETKGKPIPFRQIQMTLHTEKRKKPKTLDLIVALKTSKKPVVIMAYAAQGKLRLPLFETFLNEVSILP